MKSEISLKILGFDINASNEEHFILTNIQPIYDGLISLCSIYGHSQGFYNSVALNFSEKKYRLIKITPGNVIIDVLKVLNAKAKSITLIGLVGSLNAEYNIGKIVQPKFVSNFTSLKSKKVLNKQAVSELRICQVNGLVQQEYFYKQLLSMGIDFVDMESYYLTSYTSKKTNLKLIGIVSDMPLQIPFYKDIDIKFDYKTLLPHL
jgi:hypothetical protein